MADYIAKIFNETEITFWGEFEGIPKEIFPRKPVVIEFTKEIEEKVAEGRFRVIKKEAKSTYLKVLASKKDKNVKESKNETKLETKEQETK